MAKYNWKKHKWKKHEIAGSIPKARRVTFPLFGLSDPTPDLLTREMIEHYPFTISRVVINEEAVRNLIGITDG